MSNTTSAPQKAEYPSAEALMDEAEQKTGLSNFGTDEFREGLNMFLNSIATEIELTEERAAPILDLVRRRLVNRLEIEEWYRTHPEIATLPITGPVSVTGLPRTGTSALANIMSLDDDFRGLRVWEQAKPCPPPILGEDLTDPRRVAAIAHVEMLTQKYPEQMAMHLYDADATEEDVEVLGLEFRAQQLALPIFKYHAWWRDVDMRPTFAYHRRITQLLQSRRPPNRWLFKAPAHNFHLEAIVSAYPDARFIITHRDPAKAVPSAISLISSLIPPGSVTPEYMHEFGRLHCEHLRIGAERAIAARTRIGEDRFFDVDHRDLQRDIFGTLERIYHFLGMELRPGTREKMAQWHAKNRTGAHGAHHYTAEQYGLSVPQLRSDFDFYIRRFNVPV